jgi:hypothetical protein
MMVMKMMISTKFEKLLQKIYKLKPRGIKFIINQSRRSHVLTTGVKNHCIKGNIENSMVAVSKTNKEIKPEQNKT